LKLKNVFLKKKKKKTFNMSQSASNLDSIVRPINVILDGSNYSMLA